MTENITSRINAHCLEHYGKKYDIDQFYVFMAFNTYGYERNPLHKAYYEVVTKLITDYCTSLKILDDTLYIYPYDNTCVPSMGGRDDSFDQIFGFPYGFLYVIDNYASPGYIIYYDRQGNGGYTDYYHVPSLVPRSRLIDNPRWYISHLKYPEYYNPEMIYHMGMNYADNITSVYCYPKLIKTACFDVERAPIYTDTNSANLCMGPDEFPDGMLERNIRIVFGGVPDGTTDGHVDQFEEFCAYELDDFSQLGEVVVTHDIFGEHTKVGAFQFVPNQDYYDRLADIYEVVKHDDQLLAIVDDRGIYYVPFCVHYEAHDYARCVYRLVGLIKEHRAKSMGEKLIYNGDRIVKEIIADEMSSVWSGLCERKKRLEANTKRLAEITKHIADSEKEINRLGMIDPAEYSAEIINTIQTLSKVESFGYVGNNKYVAVLKPLICEAKRKHVTQYKVQLPKIMVTLDMDEQTITYDGCPWLVNGSMHCLAPHVRDGTGCHGDAMTTSINTAFSMYNIPLLIMLAIQYLEQANLDDAWGVEARYMPITEVINNNDPTLTGDYSDHDECIGDEGY